MKSMKTKIYIIIVLLLICAMIFSGIYLNQKSIDNAYNYAITLIQNGSYEGALLELEKANPNLLDRKEFKDDIKYQKLNEAYKNTVSLYAYALAQAEYNDENKSMYTVNDYLELIPTDYSGELCEEIKTFKGNFKPQYEEFLEEQKRRDEELRLRIEESERQYYAKLKTKIPYEGMSESDINKTIVGNYHKIDTSSKYGKTKYYWYANNSNDIVLIVECKDGKVTDVIKYFQWVYWTSDGMPNFGAVKPKTTTKSSSSKQKSDPYNVYDYSDPEDFYYDNYDDFWDYEDAEDYFNEHHED